ncbi:MAG: hypothetical protein GY835_05745 [bacterium]|nr:hypothetical protein [bacterium]
MNPSKERALVRLANEILGKPFKWGQLDCNILALRWLDLLTGSEELAAIVGRYSTKAEAARFAAESDRTLVEILLEHEVEFVEPGFQQPGDFLVTHVEGEPWHRAHICTGHQVLSVDIETGGRLIPLSDLVECSIYRVGGA